MTAPGQRHAPGAPRAEPHTPEPAAPLWPFCRRSQEIREDLLEINPCLFNARARALLLSKSGLHSGVGYFQFYVKCTATALPAIGKFIQKRARKVPRRLPPPSLPACLRHPVASASADADAETALRFQIRKGTGGEETGLRSKGGAEGAGWRRRAAARDTPSCRWTCVSVCLQSEEPSFALLQAAPQPLVSSLPPPQSKGSRFRKFTYPARGFIVLSEGPGLACAHPSPSRAGQRLFIHMLPS